MKKMRLLALVLALFLAIVATTSYAASATNQPAGGSHFVRVPATSQSELAQLQLNPAISLDYGSFLWLELNDADLAALTASGISFTAVPDAGQVQIVTHQFDPISEGEPAIAPTMRADDGQSGFHLIQFNGPVRDEWLQTLEAAGLPMLQYYPHNAYLTWGSAAAVENAANASFVRWQGPVHPAYKIDANLAGRNGRIHNVDIMFYNDGNIEATLSALKALGATVLQHYPSQPDRAFYDAVVQIDASALTGVAQLNTVLWLGFLGPEPILDDEMSAQILAGNHPGGTPVTGYNAHLAALGVDGTGVTWAIIDTGVDYAHPDLNTRIGGGYDYPGAPVGAGPGDDCSGGGHGTHVSGIVGGDATAGFQDGNGFFYGLGMAPEVTFFASNSLCAPSWPPAGGWQEHSKRAVLGGAIGGNNSWTTGEGTNHGYQASERTHDIMVRDGNFDTASVAEPFIEVFSAGNSGPGGSTLTAPKEAKNLIIVASSLNFREGNINTISSFSSRGPAVDGRWVPTITAPGSTIASTRRLAGGAQCATPIGGTSNNYAFCSGTSMAAPHASGAVVLFTEWWRGFNSGADPSPAMAKALVVNSAVDMATADIPNVNEGWGRINITNILSPSVPFVFRDQIDTFTATGEQVVLNLGVVDPTKPVRITLTWSDAPGAVGANPALVNNLNLTVVNNSNTYRGNVFSGGWSTTGGSADNINNLENVYIQNPGSDLTITIDAANIAGDGVPYNGDPTDQDFALICQNCAGGADFTLSVTPPIQSICTGPDVDYTVNVGSVLGYDDDVTLSASGHPAGTTANFSVNPVTPPGSSVLTIGNTGAAAGGNYAISVVGVAPTSTHTATVQLELFAGAPGVPTLLTPADMATNIPVTPEFTWGAISGATSYYLELADDINFSNIIYTTTVAGTSHTLPGANALDYSTWYYWRVTASNPCGSGVVSSEFRFRTVDQPDIFCSTPNLPIPDDPDVSDTITISANGNILDVDVYIDASHTWVGDLIFTLSHNATNAVIIDRPGRTTTGFGCSGNDYDVTVNDEGADGDIESQCADAPAIFGDRVGGDPANTSLLAAFDGMDINGNWTLTISDAAGGDTGTLNEWCVVPTLEAGGAGVDLSPSQAASGAPGSVVSYTLTLTNTGSVSDTFDLSVDAQWTTLLSQSSITLDAGAVGSFTAEVTVPVTATTGATGLSLVTAVSQSDNSVSDDAFLTTTATAVYGVSASADPDALSGEPGEVLTYTVHLTNTGNTTDTFSLSTSDDNGWMSHVEPVTVTLAAGASDMVMVMVHVDMAATDGEVNVTTVTAVSDNDPSATATVDLTSTADTADFLIYLPIILKP